MFQKLKAKVQLVRDDCRYFGLGAATRNLVLWAVRKIITYRVAIIYGAEVGKLASLAPSYSGLTFSMEPARDIPWGVLEAADIQVAVDSEEIFIVRLVSEIAFVARVASRSFTIPKRHVVTVPDDAIYISCCYTASLFRGRGLYGIGVCQIASLHRAAARNVFLYVEIENDASTQAVLKMGFKPIARSSILGWGPFTTRKFVALAASPFPSVRPV